MNSKNELILEKNGWVIESYSPLEIRHSDGSFASEQAARIVIAKLTENEEEDRLLSETLNSIERSLIEKALVENNYVIAEAAKDLHVTEIELTQKIREFGIEVAKP